MAEVFTTSGAVINKAGANVNTTASNSGAMLTKWIEEAEGYINSITRYDFTTNWATAEATMKTMLSEAAANLAAIYLINYDMSGYTSRLEAETMLDVLMERFNQCIKVIRDQKTVQELK